MRDELMNATTKRLYVFFMLMFATLTAMTQTTITGTVLDSDSKEPIVGATISNAQTHKALTVTDLSGQFSIESTKATTIKISFIGYEPQTMTLSGNSTFHYYLKQEIKTLDEVVVTAQESRKLSSTSVIQKHAMEHLQPSSFTDILELLPGGRSKDPNLTSPNNIKLREAGEVSGYSTTSLGTQFVVDGARVSTNANMQYVAGSWDATTTSRENMNSGVDMRSISTDDIEKVEIVRGIASVEYGDLTSGLVKIERKKGGHDLNARLKADMKSKLFYIAKGLEWEHHKVTLNMSFDFLNAKADPRNRLENYKRATISTRFNKNWAGIQHKMSFTANLDYTGSFDNDKIDPDLNNQVEDSFRSTFNRYMLFAKFNFSKLNARWFKSFDASASASYEQDKIERTGLVQLSRSKAAPTSTVEGESDAVILPYKYVAWHHVEGKPLNAYIKLNARFQVPSASIFNSLLLGVDFNIDKNYGKGQIFEITRPLYPTTIATRPRKLSTIPAEQQLAFYAQERVIVPIGGNSLEIEGGVRATQLLNLKTVYAMHGKFYWDPRVNVGWSFPKFTIVGQPAFARISGGVGEHTKMPTMSQLYPNLLYMDLIQLSYYHTNPDFRRINLMTYVVDPTNHALKPARNFKWEVSGDINVGGNRLSITVFREDLQSGFRSQSSYAPYTYKKYDASRVDAEALTGPPSLENMPYTIEQELEARTQYTNGSETLKRGIEYTFASRRIEKLYTRLTINGAFFNTIYRNSQVETYKPNQVIDNKPIQYVGYYKHDGGRENSMCNTNFVFDTDIPKLKLGFSLSAQCLWFTSSKQKEVSNYPVSYMDGNGVMHAWKEGDEKDICLRWLVRNFTASQYEKRTVPFSMNLNFKVTKKLFDEKMNVALFCNKIWDYTPDYTSKGATIRRHVNPYFGLEMNFKL